MSVLISFISPLIECEKSYLAIILSLVPWRLHSFCTGSDKRMMCALSLRCHTLRLKAFQEGEEQAVRLPGCETLSQPCQEHRINFQYVSFIVKTCTLKMLLYDSERRRDLKRDFLATMMNSLCLYLIVSNPKWRGNMLWGDFMPIWNSAMCSAFRAHLEEILHVQEHIWSGLQLPWFQINVSQIQRCFFPLTIDPIIKVFPRCQKYLCIISLLKYVKISHFFSCVTHNCFKTYFLYSGLQLNQIF